MLTTSLRLMTICLLPAAASAQNWPAWRGPAGMGVCTEKGLPEKWSTTENVRWKIDLPDSGNSTPVIWGEKIFLTQAVNRGKERSTLGLRRADGGTLWKQTIPFGEEEPTHEDNPYCSASPVTDGERVIVSHGSAGIFAYDLDGKELWRRDLGKFRHIWGNAASPVIDGDLCYMNCGPGERTFLIALDKRTGKTIWQKDIAGGREGGDVKTWTGSWSTPLARPEGRPEVVVSYPDRLRAFHPQTGAELWSCAGLGLLAYSSPVAGEGVVLGFSGFMGPAIAVRAGGTGDITETHRLWRQERNPQRIGSAAIAGGNAYIVNENGVAECLELATGKSIWRERVCGATWSSPLLAEGKLYILDMAGDCAIFRAAPKFELVGKNSLGEMTRASLAVSSGDLFIRTYKRLWCLRAARP